MKRRHDGPPMDLANMRQSGVRSLSVSCPACHRSVRFNVDAYPEHVAVVAFGPRIICTRCGMIGADAREGFELARDRAIRRCYGTPNKIT